MALGRVGTDLCKWSGDDYCTDEMVLGRVGTELCNHWRNEYCVDEMTYLVVRGRFGTEWCNIIGDLTIAWTKWYLVELALNCVIIIGELALKWFNSKWMEEYDPCMDEMVLGRVGTAWCHFISEEWLLHGRNGTWSNWLWCKYHWRNSYCTNEYGTWSSWKWMV